MSYGIQIISGNGNVQIDSNTSGTGLIVVDNGTATSTPSRVNLDHDFVFIRPTATTGNNYVTISRGTADSNGDYFISFKRADGSSINCDFIIAKTASIQTQSSSGYGDQIFNSDGDLAFDSGLYTGDGGFGVTSFLDSFEATGNFDLMSTDLTEFGSVNFMVYGSALDAGLVFVNDYNSHTSTSVQSNGIYYRGTFTITFAFGGTQVSDLTNLSAIFIAETGSV